MRNYKNLYCIGGFCFLVFIFTCWLVSSSSSEERVKVSTDIKVAQIPVVDNTTVKVTKAEGKVISNVNYSNDPLPIAKDAKDARERAVELRNKARASLKLAEESETLAKLARLKADQEEREALEAEQIALKSEERARKEIDEIASRLDEAKRMLTKVSISTVTSVKKEEKKIENKIVNKNDSSNLSKSAVIDPPDLINRPNNTITIMEESKQKTITVPSLKGAPLQHTN